MNDPVLCIHRIPVADCERCRLAAKAQADIEARSNPRPCDVCHRPEWLCRKTQLRVDAALRHPYQPLTRHRQEELPL